MANILITGANRGIGLELVRQYLARGDRVFAGVREPQRAEELKKLSGKLVVVQLNVADENSIRSARDAVKRQTDRIELLVNNAGINPPYGEQKLGALKMETGMQVMRTNAVGPLIMVQEFLELLRKGTGKIASITSGWGSISGNDGSFPCWYSGSKAALNMMMRSVAGEVGKEGMASVVISPGWVKTDMGSDAAPLSPEESVRGIIRVIDGLGAEDNGKFYDHKGGEVAW